MDVCSAHVCPIILLSYNCSLGTRDLIINSGSVSTICSQKRLLPAVRYKKRRSSSTRHLWSSSRTPGDPRGRLNRS